MFAIFPVHTHFISRRQMRGDYFHPLTLLCAITNFYYSTMFIIHALLHHCDYTLTSLWSLPLCYDTTIFIIPVLWHYCIYYLCAVTLLLLLSLRCDITAFITFVLWLHCVLSLWWDIIVCIIPVLWYNCEALPAQWQHCIFRAINIWGVWWKLSLETGTWGGLMVPLQHRSITVTCM